MSYMNCNKFNSPYVEPYMYAIDATSLQLCKNNYCVIAMQPICNYDYNIMLTLLFIHPSMNFFVDFHCNSLATIGVMKNTLMVTINLQLCDNSHWHKVIFVFNYNVSNLQMVTR
jgi:hypothetical protein